MGEFAGERHSGGCTSMAHRRTGTTTRRSTSDSRARETMAGSAGPTWVQAMSRPLIVRAKAEADVRKIHEYLDATQIGLGDKFAARLRQVFERIESMPESCGCVARRPSSAFAEVPVRRLLHFIRGSHRGVGGVARGARRSSVAIAFRIDRPSQLLMDSAPIVHPRAAC